MTELDLISLAEKAVENLKHKNKTLALAESCTGGWVSKLITDVSGASAVYQGGVCSYSNQVKTDILGVKEEALCSFGAVSEQVAIQMAEGVKKALKSHIGIGITGIAGPLSDNTAKPVGLIYVAIADESKTNCIELRNNFTEDIRLQNRMSAAETALTLLGDI
ncbi:MAG: CinA family protein [Clostridia bacterium]|nr:CinA family protein [Clostridia bacterium]